MARTLSRFQTLRYRNYLSNHLRSLLYMNWKLSPMSRSRINGYRTSSTQNGSGPGGIYLSPNIRNRPLRWCLRRRRRHLLKLLGYCFLSFHIQPKSGHKLSYTSQTTTRPRVCPHHPRYPPRPTPRCPSFQTPHPRYNGSKSRCQC